MESKLRQAIRVIFDDLVAERIVLTSLNDVAQCIYDMRYKDLLQYPLTESVINQRERVIHSYTRTMMRCVQSLHGADRYFSRLLRETPFADQDQANDTRSYWYTKLHQSIFAVEPGNELEETQRQIQWRSLSSEIASAIGPHHALHPFWSQFIHFAQQPSQQQEYMLEQDTHDGNRAQIGLSFLLQCVPTLLESEPLGSVVALNCRGEITETPVHTGLLPSYHIRMPHIVLSEDFMSEKERLVRHMQWVEKVLVLLLQGEDEDEPKDIGDIYLDGFLVTSLSSFESITHDQEYNVTITMQEERNNAKIIITTIPVED